MGFEVEYSVLGDRQRREGSREALVMFSGLLSVTGAEMDGEGRDRSTH